MFVAANKNVWQENAKYGVSQLIFPMIVVMILHDKTYPLMYDSINQCRIVISLSLIIDNSATVQQS